MGSAIPDLAGPSARFCSLNGSPFGSYLVPGMILALVLGGAHSVAFLLTLRRRPWYALASAVAAFATLIWISVQMAYIPFSFLQAAYFGFGMAEIGCIMLLLVERRPMSLCLSIVSQRHCLSPALVCRSAPRRRRHSRRAQGRARP